MKSPRAWAVLGWAVWAALAAGPVWAAGDATACRVKILKVHFKDLGGEWVRVKDLEGWANLAEDEPILTFVNQGRIRPGTYQNVRIVISEEIEFAGMDGRFATREGGRVRVGGTAWDNRRLPGQISALESLSPTCTTDEEPALVREHLDLDYEDRDDHMMVSSRKDFRKPFKIREGSSVKLWLTLSLQNTVTYVWPEALGAGMPSENTLYFLPSNDVEELAVTVDAATSYAPSSDLVLDF